MTLEELDEVERYFFTQRIPLQRKRAIEETVKIEVTIDPDAEPGIRDLRLVAQAGALEPHPLPGGRAARGPGAASPTTRPCRWRPRWICRSS